jgi:hypothetical protein
MRFRRRWLAKINIVFTNQITSLFAGLASEIRLRTSRGSEVGEGLPDSRERLSSAERLHLRAQLQQRVCEERARSRRMRTKYSRKEYQLSAPTIVHDPTRQRFSLPVRIVMRILGAGEYMRFSVDLFPGWAFDSPPVHP